jgi:hypothetical protein
MSIDLDLERRHTGTRFRLYPQPPYAEEAAVLETVWVSPPAGSVGAGPSDQRMYVVDPIGKPRSYGPSPNPRGGTSLYLPPWDGPARAPALPDAEGHFDDLEPGTPEFEAAHVYGSVRFVLDIWEDYFGHTIDWHFASRFEQMEISLLRDLNNALMGYGFLEVGYDQTLAGPPRPFTLNFDVVAHEVGHAIIYSQVGVPTPETQEGEYFGFQESAADQVALISLLHFESVVERLLARTRGNLYTLNRLNRIAELSEHEQLRLAANSYTLTDFAAGWTDEHILAQPLTGAVFDILVDVFHEELLERRLISPKVEDLADQLEYRSEYAELIQSLFDAAYADDPEGFKEALLDTRDTLGLLLAGAWSRLSPHSLNFEDVGDALLDADLALTGGRYQTQILQNFRWRDIGAVTVGPRLAPPDEDSHAFSARTLVPGEQRRVSGQSYYERKLAAVLGRDVV